MIRIARVLAVLAPIPLLLALWPSDRWPVLALIAYVPALFCMIAAAAALALFGRKGASGRWVALAMTALALSLASIAVDNRAFFSQHRLDPGMSVVHWNIARSNGLAEELRDFDADILCLSEYTGSYAGEWHVSGIGELRILSKRAPHVVYQWSGEGVRMVLARIDGVTILLVDVTASPLVHRRKPLQQLRAHLRVLPPPDLIVGDLNTPAGSFSLREAFDEFDDCYGLAGRGPACTWPSYLPLMRIDHALARRGIGVLDYTTGFNRKSDHRWQRIVIERPTAQ